MRKFVPAVLAGVLMIGFSAPANANGHHKRHLRVLENSYETTYWEYRTSWRGSGPPPYAAFQPIVRYGPGNRRCVSTLVQLPSGWWQPVKRCEIVRLG